MNRRVFLASAPALVGLARKSARPVEGGFVNDAFPLGHRLRDRAAFRPPAREVRVPVVVVGGGMAGLSAAWRLEKRGFRDFALLEMEPQAGGNSRWGETDAARFPWAAHYVPVPAKGASLARELFEELGVLKDGKWDERALCFDPQERLFLHGRWQEGLEPELGAAAKDREQYRRFNARMREFRASGDFTIPMQTGAERYARAPLDRISMLDRQSMAEWLAAEKLDSPYLRWYVDYACRDDYGALAKDASAWAGVHYFAAREPEEKGPLTWPEGNGWIARRLIAKLERYIHTGVAVYRLAPDRTKIRVLTDSAGGPVAYVADAVVFAAPTFLAAYLIDGAPPAEGFEYSPWLTANLSLDRLPQQKGAELAWDNVIFDSPALGYVNANHMSVARPRDAAVWTYYWALAAETPARGRARLLENDWGYWKEAILNDLGRAHPDIGACVSRIDIMRFGHAMARPTPGFVFSNRRRRWTQPAPGPAARIFYANSDLSGFSIFEEAQYRGVVAAERALAEVGGGRKELKRAGGAQHL